MSIGDYDRNPPVFVCCGGPMARHITVAPGVAIGNALAGDRHYDGLRATDGTDISSRAKHRAYMKAHNLTTVDDYRQTWAKAAAERRAMADGVDPARKTDVANAIHALEAR